MRTRLMRTLLPLVVMFGTALVDGAAEAGQRHRGTAVDAAAIYPAPHPVHSPAAATPYMYQPLYPHEFMHKHLHVYRRYDGPSRLFPTNTTRAFYW